MHDCAALRFCRRSTASLASLSAAALPASRNSACPFARVLARVERLKRSALNVSCESQWKAARRANVKQGRAEGERRTVVNWETNFSWATKPARKHESVHNTPRILPRGLTFTYTRNACDEPWVACKRACCALAWFETVAPQVRAAHLKEFREGHR